MDTERGDIEMARRHGVKYVCAVPEGASVVCFNGLWCAADPKSEAKILSEGGWQVDMPMMLKVMNDRAVGRMCNVKL